MPAKITASTTDNLSGLVSVSDVQKIINDFIDLIQLNATDSARNPVGKYYSFDISLSKIQEVIEGSNGADNTKIRVNFALNLPGQRNCSDTGLIENYVSILVCAVGEDDSSLLRIDDSILADGFRDFATIAPDCCVQGRPR